MNAHQRDRRNEKVRRVLLRTVVWIVLVVFIVTSVGVAFVVNFAAR